MDLLKKEANAAVNQKKTEVRLAAMDGMSHAAFRSICFEYGADAATTEMVPAVGYARARKKRLPSFDALLLRRPEETALGAQIIGSCPAEMAEAARRLEAVNRFDWIEINMGCPARTVVRGGNGSALLQNLPLAGRILTEVCGAVHLPVKLKLRLGWDAQTLTAPELARMAEDAGCSEVILHGRTREQFYLGEPDIEAMQRVQQAISIPLIANGGVVCAADVERFRRATGADGVAIGRAALRMPWIFADARSLAGGEEPRQHPAPERIDLLLRMAERLTGIKPELYAIREMRKFCNWYLSGFSGADEVIRNIYEIRELNALRDTLLKWQAELIRSDDLLPHAGLLPEATLDTVER